MPRNRYRDAATYLFDFRNGARRTLNCRRPHSKEQIYTGAAAHLSAEIHRQIMRASGSTVVNQLDTAGSPLKLYNEATSLLLSIYGSVYCTRSWCDAEEIDLFHKSARSSSHRGDLDHPADAMCVWNGNAVAPRGPPSRRQHHLGLPQLSIVVTSGNIRARCQHARPPKAPALTRKAEIPKRERMLRTQNGLSCLASWPCRAFCRRQSSVRITTGRPSHLRATLE